MTALIRACGDYYAPIGSGDASLPELKTLVAESIGEPVRRIGRFIQLALIGAGRCVGAHKLPEDTGVYLASGRGDLEVTLEVMEQLFRHGQPPKPLTFINSVSNSACFYVARQLGLNGRSSFVCNRYFAFESVLGLALSDLAAGTVRSALVGCVDAATKPLADHRHRLELAPDAPLAEGSHWLWLVAGEGRPAVLAVEHCTSRAELQAWIASLALTPERTRVAWGQFLDPALQEGIAGAAGLNRSFEYRTGLGYYDSHSAAAPGEFIRRHPGETLLHINGDPDGRFTALLCHA